MVIPAAESIDTEISPEGLIRLIYHDTATEFSSRIISDGTLRVLALFAILGKSNGASTIGFEEPENGVHPRRLGLIARLLQTAAFRPIGDRKQLIITTHSSHLPGFMNPGHHYEDFSIQTHLIRCGKEGGITTFESLPTTPMLVEGDAEYSLGEAILRGDFGG